MIIDQSSFSMEEDENIDNDFTKRTTDFYKSGAKRYKIVTFAFMSLYIILFVYFYFTSGKTKKR